jgi:hypothetical protein
LRKIGTWLVTENHSNQLPKKIRWSERDLANRYMPFSIFRGCFCLVSRDAYGALDNV